MESTFTGRMSNTAKFYYSKRKSSSGLVETSRSAMGRQSLIPLLDTFEVGAFYKIDHTKLPPKSPIQLKAIRVVKVSQVTELDLTVNFPSILSLRNHFLLNPGAAGIPELDEKFVMSYNYARKALTRKLLLHELEAEKHLQSFWLSSPVLPPETDTDDTEQPMMSPPVSRCLMELKSSDFPEWGVRRRVKYVGRHRMIPQASAEEEDTKDDVATPRKRTKKSKKKSKSKKRKLDKPETSRERWSNDRYLSAELKLLQIMRDREADIKNPILRPELREEARKHIGDTGLLDHLLKHMAGKVIGNGNDRFQRRHNADGAMEYWIEPAELMEIRKKAGVLDPFWVPPSGWKVGDSTTICSGCGVECRKEIGLVKEEMARNAQLLEEHTEARAAAAEEKYEQLQSLVTKMEAEMSTLTTKMGAEMSTLTTTVEELKEEVKKLREEKEKKATETIDNNGSITGVHVEPRRSGFTICKPLGTFLWPNQGGGNSVTSLAGGGGGGDGLPTPRSTSSTATSAVMNPFLTPSPTTPTSSSPAFLVGPPPAQPADPDADGQTEKGAGAGSNSATIMTELALATPSTYHT